MTEQFVTPEIEVNQEARVNMNDLYSVLKKWFTLQGYFTVEKEYEDSGGGNFKIKWVNTKEIDDYHKYKIETSIKGKDCKLVEEEKGKLVEGKIILTFEASVEFDYEEKWNAPFRRFIRDFYDTYIKGENTKQIKQDLVDETYDLVNKIRGFLRQHHF